MPDQYTQPDVSPAAIEARRLDRIIGQIMADLVDNNICHYTDVNGYYNDNYVRTVEVIRKHLK